MSLRIENARVAPDELCTLHIEAERITARWRRGDSPPADLPRAERVLDVAGRVVLPGFIDAHTHCLWAGDRLDEFSGKLAEVGYLEVLRAGGGIMATVRAVRSASRDELVEGLLGRLDRMLAGGTTTIEVKSGYGLTTRDELKMLEAIELAAESFPGTLVATALLGHAIDLEQPDFVDRTIEETLPAVHERFPGIAIDAFCEEGAWSRAQCERLFRAALALGHPLRVHSDQFHSLGMTPCALELGARSVDHLEATTPDHLKALARSRSYAVMLPAACFHLETPYPDARRLLDEGGRLALATNFNPGSSPSGSMPFVIALACRKLGLTVEEAIRACTAAPAELLGLSDRGSLRPGLRADLIVLTHRDVRSLAFELGGNPVERVICAGREVYSASSILRAGSRDIA